jgi:hypothetical protein
MADLQGFDASQEKEMMSFDPIPAGKYPLIATDVEWKSNKAGTGRYLQFTLEVLDGQFKGRKVWVRLNLENPSETAVDIARRELAALCKAVGIVRPSDSTDLLNKPFVGSVDVEKAKDTGKEGNKVTKYEPMAGGAAAPNPMQPTTFTQPAAAAKPAANAAPPWARNAA